MASKHHYISRFHLNEFVDPRSASAPEPWLWVGEIATGTLKRRSPKNVGWKRGMFDGPGALADDDSSLEEHLASQVEPAAAKALRSFCRCPPGEKVELPPPLGLYLGWAAARSLTMASLYQQWAGQGLPESTDVAEPPPLGWDQIKPRARTHRMEHSELGTKVEVPTDQFEALLGRGWNLKLGRDDLLELIHLQAWYFQVRFFPRLRWGVLHAPAGRSFVIGDRPVVWGFHGDLAVQPNWLRHPYVQLLAPLSRSVALFAHHADASPPAAVRPEQVNAVMATAAKDWIAGPSEAAVVLALKQRTSG